MPAAAECRETINGAIAPPIELPLSNSPVARARRRFGNHSPTTLVAAGQFPDSPAPSRKQNAIKSCTDAVHQPAAHRLPDGVSHAESDDYVSVVGIGPVVLQLKIRGEKRKSLAV
jgi:hypothetical protein